MDLIVANQRFLNKRQNADTIRVADDAWCPTMPGIVSRRLVTQKQQILPRRADYRFDRYRAIERYEPALMLAGQSQQTSVGDLLMPPDQFRAEHVRIKQRCGVAPVLVMRTLAKLA